MLKAIINSVNLICMTYTWFSGGGKKKKLNSSCDHLGLPGSIFFGRMFLWSAEKISAVIV